MHSKGPTCRMCSSSVAKPPPTLIIIWLDFIMRTPARVPIMYLHLSGYGRSSSLMIGKSAIRTTCSSASLMILRYSNFSMMALFGR